MSQIIQTRYRDIPFEEAVACSDDPTGAHSNREDHEKRRGRPVNIETPPIGCPMDVDGFGTCSGPFYRIYDMPHKCVCGHVAEIGD